METTVYCGVDLHYSTSSFSFLTDKGEVRQAIEIATDKIAIEKLLGEYKSSKVAYAFEAGNMATYFHRIVNQMPNTKKIHVVHPYKFKIISESKHKNDKEDSLKLAKGLLKDYLPEPVYIKSEICRQIKFLLNIRRRMVVTKSGLVPSEHSSGEKIRRGGITKEGVKELRTLLVQAGWHIMRMKRNNDFRLGKMRKKFYRISNKQKSSQKAVTAIARHLSRIIFGVLKSNTPYCGDLANKAKAC